MRNLDFGAVRCKKPFPQSLQFLYVPEDSISCIKLLT